MLMIVGGRQAAFNNAHATFTPRLSGVEPLLYNERMKRYPIPAREYRTEIQVSNSRFIATLAPAFSVEEARAFIARVREEFADATHNVPAFVVGHGASVIAHCSDDGEPSGTAGRPALAVLQGSGLGDAALVITRYFGGTKLGTGGLVRAYGDAARQVLAQAPLAEKVPTQTLMLAIPYGLLEQVRLLVTARRGQVLDEAFAADVTLTARLASEHVDAFQAALRELSNGLLLAEVIESDEATIMALDSLTPGSL
jgi:uncharacterized YigZ family protein